jgi:integrase
MEEKALAVQPPLLPEETAVLTARVRSSRSPSTWKAYAKDWEDFTRFCRASTREALPASPETLSLYLESLAQKGKKVSTLNRRLAAISVRHKGEGLATPSSSELVRSVLAGIRRDLGVAPRRAKPLRLSEIRLAATDDLEPSSLASLRERALILLGYAGAFRRSELSSLLCEDIEWRREGLAITVRKSKTDQEAKGQMKGIVFGRSPQTCPVKALEAWLQAAGIDRGPVFRPLKKGGGVGSGRLSGVSISEIVKTFCGRAGLDPEMRSSHSLRAGFVTDGYAAGASEPAIMDQTGHRSREVLAMYRREASLFENASSLLGM